MGDEGTGRGGGFLGEVWGWVGGSEDGGWSGEGGRGGTI